MSLNHLIYAASVDLPNNLKQEIDDIFQKRIKKETGYAFDKLSQDLLSPKTQKNIKAIFKSGAKEYSEEFLILENDLIATPIGLSSINIYRHNPIQQQQKWVYENRDFAHLNAMLTAIIFIDNYEVNTGLEFLNQEMFFQPDEGSLLVFPSYFTHIHKFHNPITKPKKFIATTFQFGGIRHATSY